MPHRLEFGGWKGSLGARSLHKEKYGLAWVGQVAGRALKRHVKSSSETRILSSVSQIPLWVATRDIRLTRTRTTRTRTRTRTQSCRGNELARHRPALRAPVVRMCGDRRSNNVWAACTQLRPHPGLLRVENQEVCCLRPIHHLSLSSRGGSHPSARASTPS